MNLLTDVKSVFVVLKKVFGNKKYLKIGIIVAFVFYLLNGFIVSRPRFIEFFELYGFLAVWKLFIVSINYSYEILPETFIGIVILSLLVGMIIGLLVYRFDNFAHIRGGNILATLGIFLGMAAPGCAACGVGLISLFGLGSTLAVLPYNGREVMGIAIIISGLSVLMMSQKLYNPICKINCKKLSEKQLKSVRMHSKNSKIERG